MCKIFCRYFQKLRVSMGLITYPLSSCDGGLGGGGQEERVVFVG